MENINELVGIQRNFFLGGETLDYAFRKGQLQKLKKMLKNYEKNIYQALKADLNKSSYETLTTEIGLLYSEIDYALKHLGEWMEPEKADAPLTHKGTKSYIHKEPYGVTLVIAPWNYPLQLAIAPAIGAIAAGNTVVLKPSEFTPKTSSLLFEMISATFDPSYFAVVEGEKKVSEVLLNQQFDYIFFTGSTAVGKIIMKQASVYLTPVTLELGGKSPAIIDRDANIDLAAKRIIWGKFTNAGQTCIAPDYLYVHENVKNKILAKMKKHIQSLYGKNPLKNENYVRIVSQNHFNRLTAFLTNGTVYCGGNINQGKLTIEPTILDDVSWNDPIMEEEIFGPILPIITFNNLDEIIATIKTKDKPLALYYFGEKEKTQKKVMQSISFGGGCVNDTLYHFANANLPFGGVGSSGMGSYHGKASFDTFSHRKSILKHTTKFDIPLRYPGGKLSEVVIKGIMK